MTKIQQIQTDVILPRMAELQISKYKLAKLTGLAESTITRWFNGQLIIGFENLIKILTALELNIHIVPKELENIG